jgi:hypothetical protein
MTNTPKIGDKVLVEFVVFDVWTGYDGKPVLVLTDHKKTMTVNVPAAWVVQSS